LGQKTRHDIEQKSISRKPNDDDRDEFAFVYASVIPSALRLCLAAAKHLSM